MPETLYLFRCLHVSVCAPCAHDCTHHMHMHLSMQRSVLVYIENCSFYPAVLFIKHTTSALCVCVCAPYWAAAF